jgi:hypothetical protein
MKAAALKGLFSYVAKVKAQSAGRCKQSFTSA